MDNFDVIVIGAGPGGYVAAIRCAQLGLKTACIEKWIDDDHETLLGGTCLNAGCIPSKALLQSSDYYDKSCHNFSQHGIILDHIELNITAMMQRKKDVVNQMGLGIKQLFKSHGITLYAGKGKLLTGKQVEVTLNDGNKVNLNASNIILAPGSIPRPHPTVPYMDNLVIDSEAALTLDKVPNSIAIIGAGVIGLELGSVWHRLGSKVSIFEPTSGLLLQADPSIARQAKSIFSKQGLDFHFDSNVESCEIKSNQVNLKYTQKNEIKQQTFDKVLVSIGRIPNTAKLVSAQCDLALSESGQIQVDQYCLTNIPGVYAIGDAVRGPMLAHKSSEEGIMVAELIAGHHASVDYEHVPYIIYTNPEIAWCGNTEAELKTKKIKYKTGNFPFAANGRAHAGGEAAGLIKVISDSNTDRILGVHMIGPHVSELIQQAVIAMEFKASTEDLALSMFAHPTLSETFHEAILDVDKHSIHKLNLG